MITNLDHVDVLARRIQHQVLWLRLFAEDRSRGLGRPARAHAWRDPQDASMRLRVHVWQLPGPTLSASVACDVPCALADIAGLPRAEIATALLRAMSTASVI